MCGKFKLYFSPHLVEERVWDSYAQGMDGLDRDHSGCFREGVKTLLLAIPHAYKDQFDLFLCICW